MFFFFFWKNFEKKKVIKIIILSLHNVSDNFIIYKNILENYYFFIKL